MADDARHARVVDHARGSTGSVGDSSAPTRKASVHVRSMSALRRQRDDDGGDRHGEHELAQRQVPGPLQHLGVDLEAVAEEDEHERRDRQVVARRPSADRSPGRRARRCRAGTRRPRTPRSATGTSAARGPTAARRRRAALRARRRRLERGHAGTVPHAKRRGGIDEKCASPCWASLLPGRTPMAPAAATSSRSTTPACCWTAATASSPSCGASSTTSTSTRW